MSNRSYAEFAIADAKALLTRLASQAGARALAISRRPVSLPEVRALIAADIMNGGLPN
ncbi:MAG: hypothetical protein JY451_11300 [Erythrobacter sp.]|nr:MAG: hypothetical protein JY451_11300 [Erythrobacter sp.]